VGIKFFEFGDVLLGIAGQGWRIIRFVILESADVFEDHYFIFL
jgi:hypothetical protein